MARIQSGSLTVIVAENSSESNSPIDSLAALASEVRLRDAVFQSLVIALAVVVDQVLRDCVPKRCPPEEDHATEAFFFDGTDKALRESVQIR